MIVMQLPQFLTQDDLGEGDGIRPISQWYEISNDLHDATSSLDVPLLDPDIKSTAYRLHNLFDPRQFVLSNTDIHDLTCFVVHKLLLWQPSTPTVSCAQNPAVSESVRHALVLYMLIVQGPTYFPHAGLQYATVVKLQAHLEHVWLPMLLSQSSLCLWLLLVGLVAADGMEECRWFETQTRTSSEALGLRFWGDVVVRLQDVVWLDSPATTFLFQQKWEEACAATTT